MRDFLFRAIERARPLTAAIQPRIATPYEAAPSAAADVQASTPDDYAHVHVSAPAPPETVHRGRLSESETAVEKPDRMVSGPGEPEKPALPRIVPAPTHPEMGRGSSVQPIGMVGAGAVPVNEPSRPELLSSSSQPSMTSLQRAQPQVVRPRSARQQVELPARAEAGAVQPRTDSVAASAVVHAPARSAEPAATPVIQVSIGRIEVRAVAPAPAARAAARPLTPGLTLEEYLRQRRSGQR